MSVSATAFSSRNIIKIVNPFHIKRKSPPIFDHSKITPSVLVMFIKLNNRAVKNIIAFHLFSFLNTLNNLAHSLVRHNEWSQILAQQN